MRVKKRLQIHAVLSALLAFAICLLLLLSLSRINRANHAAEIAGEIVISAFERITLRSDYLRNDNARAKEQWFARHKEEGKLLKSASEDFRAAEDRIIIAEMVKNQGSIKTIFSTLVANREKHGLDSGSAALAHEIEERLLNQLNMRIYKEVVLSHELLESSEETRASMLRHAGWGIVSILLILIAAAIINARTMGRAITARAERLREGALSIGGGDLEHRIDIEGNDEFSEVSEAFNAMTAKLSGTYRDLAAEIEERKRAEEQTATQSAQLESVIQAVEDGIAVFDMAGNIVMVNEAHARILGYPDAEAMRKDVSYFALHFELRELDGRVIPVHDWPVSKVLRGETLVNWELLARRTDTGQSWFLSDSAAPVRDSQGRQILGLVITRDITARKQAEEALMASLHEKEVLLKEIHHRVKNNLQVISSLVSLQADNLTDERIRDELNDVRDRVRSMGLIHEKLYQTSDLARLDFAEYASSLTQALWRSHSTLAEKVRIKLAVEPVALSMEAAVPCGLILNELAGNALKHAFPNNNGGEVELGLNLDPATETVCLRVRDNGVGLPAGFDWRQPQTLGLRLVKILAGQLHGTVETATGPGTEFKIIFPLRV